MHEKKGHFLKKENFRLYLTVCFFLVSGIWYSHAAAKGAFLMGEATSLEELANLPPAETEAKSLLGKIDLNTADAEELMRLEGIGEKRAEDIVAYREEKGGFRKIEEIMEVPGIGEKVFEQIREDITIGQ